MRPDCMLFWAFHCTTPPAPPLLQQNQLGVPLWSPIRTNTADCSGSCFCTHLMLCLSALICLPYRIQHTALCWCACISAQGHCQTTCSCAHSLFSRTCPPSASSQLLCAPVVLSTCLLLQLLGRIWTCSACTAAQHSWGVQSLSLTSTDGR